MALYKELKEINGILDRWQKTPPTTWLGMGIRWWWRRRLISRREEIIEILSIKRGRKN
jgi:hypothetical protein